MHLFRSILNAHFLRYITLVVVACFIFCAQLSVQNVKTDIQNTNIAAATSITRATFNIGSTAFAADPVDPSKPEAPKASDLTLISVLNTAIGLVSLIYVPFSMLSSWLLSPDWTFGDFIHLRPVLHSLWIFVSNTVYVVFAAMLIVVAIANIFGQSDSYAIKKMLPRFIIGVIMVPFTWWVVSATLSVSSYMTGLVLRMPADIITQNSTKEKAKVNMATNCTLNFNVDATSKKIWYCDKYADVDLAEFFLKGDSAYGIIPMYAYNIFKFNELDTFKNTLNSTGTLAQANALIAGDTAYTTGDSATKNAMLQAAIIATSIGKIGVQLLMSVIFAVVFVVILIALVLVLFTRVIKMWMYAIFSPLFALRYFLGDKIDKDNALAKFDFKEFIGLAMVPVVVSAALGFGFMFIMTFKTQMEQPIEKGATQKGIDSPFITVDKNSTGTGGSIQFFGTTINIKLSDTNSNGVGANGQSVQADDLKAALFNVLSGLITPIFGIVILWMAVMAAIKTSAVAGKAVEGIEGLGKMAGDAAKKLPGMIPTGAGYTDPKTGERKNINFKQLGMAPGLAKGWMDDKETKERQTMRSWMGLGDDLKEAASAIRNAANAQKGAEIWTKSLNGSTSEERYKIPIHRDNLVEMALKSGIPSNEINIENLKTADGFKKLEKSLLDKLKTNQSLTDDQQSKITTLASGWNGSREQINELNEIFGSAQQNENIHIIKASDITMPDGFKNKKKFTINHSKEQTDYSIDMNDYTKDWTNKAEIEAYLKTKIPNTFSITETQLKELVNKIEGAWRATPTP